MTDTSIRKCMGILVSNLRKNNIDTGKSNSRTTIKNISHFEG